MEEAMNLDYIPYIVIVTVVVLSILYWLLARKP